jgi:hypothetical protein
MAVVSNTLQTFTRTELKEDLSNVINDLSPEDTPLYSMIGKTKATNVKHEWLWDRCSDGVATNKVTQGDDPAADAASALVRFCNYTQLMDKVVRVGSTQRATDNAGYEDSMAYQMAKRSIELRKDLDCALSQNGVATAGAANTPSGMAGLEQWLTYETRQEATRMSGNGTAANASLATTPGFSTGLGCVSAIVDATAGFTCTETTVKHCIENVILNSGARVKYIMMHPTLKALFATKIAGIATRYREVPRGQAAIVAGADLYVSNFGEIVLMWSRHMRLPASVGGPVIGFDPAQLACAFLQPFKQDPLAKTGHADVRMLSCEATLEVKDPRAMFKIGGAIDFTAT